MSKNINQASLDLNSLKEKVDALEPLKKKVDALEPLKKKVDGLEPLKKKVEKLESFKSNFYTIAVAFSVGTIAVAWAATAYVVNSSATKLAEERIRLLEVSAQKNVDKIADILRETTKARDDLNEFLAKVKSEKDGALVTIAGFVTEASERKKEAMDKTEGFVTATQKGKEDATRRIGEIVIQAGKEIGDKIQSVEQEKLAAIGRMNAFIKETETKKDEAYKTIGIIVKEAESNQVLTLDTLKVKKQIEFLGEQEPRLREAGTNRTLTYYMDKIDKKDSNQLEDLPNVTRHSMWIIRNFCSWMNTDYKVFDYDPSLPPPLPLPVR